jgi:hypothetical protein
MENVTRLVIKMINDILSIDYEQVLEFSFRGNIRQIS